MHHQNPLNLPEIQSHISKYLSRHDILQCACVSKTWNETFLPQIWRYQKIHWRRRLPGVERLKINRHWVHTFEIQPECSSGYVLNYPRLHSLIIKSGRISEKWLLDIVKLNPTISHLDTSATFPFQSDLMETISGLVNLNSLTIRYALFTSQDCIDSLWRLCHRIERLKLWDVKLFDCSIPADLTCPGMKHLVINNPRYLKSKDEIELISRCPELIKLTWNLKDGNKPEALERFIQLCRFKTWPEIKMLNLGASFADDEVETILDSMVGLTKLNLRGVFQQRASEALGNHFHSLVKLDLQFCEGVNYSTTLRDVLCSCPRLLKFSAGIVAAKDILEGGDWVCTRLKTIRIQIVFEVEAHSEAELHMKIFERMGHLVELEELHLGNDSGISAMDCSLDFRLGYGLELMINMKQLRHVNFMGTRQELSIKEVDWITTNLPKVKHIAGLLHRKPKQDVELRGILKSRGVSGC